MRSANLGEQGVVEEVVGALGEGAPGHVLHTEVLHVFVCGLLLPEHVGLHLVERRRHLRERAEVEQAHRVEVAHADAAHQALLERALHVAPGAVVVVVGLVQKHHVDVIEAQKLERGLDGIVGLALAVVAHPHLVHQEDVLARHAALGDGCAHAALVHVGLRRVDETVSCGQSIADAALGGIVVNLEDAVSQHRHLHSVCELRVFHGICLSNRVFALCIVSQPSKQMYNAFRVSCYARFAY